MPKLGMQQHTIILLWRSCNKWCNGWELCLLQVRFKLLNSFLFLISHSEHSQGLPRDSASSHPRGKWPDTVLQRHQGAHLPHLPVRHLVHKKGRHLRGHSDVWSSGRRRNGITVHSSLLGWGHPIGPRQERIVWAGDHPTDDVRSGDLRMQRDGVDAWTWGDVDKNRGEQERDGGCHCHSYR